jgi:hypothetical protein
MDTEKLGQEPAFAKSAFYHADGGVDSPNEGMSKRFYAACAAMQGILASWQSDISFPNMAKEEPKRQLINTAYAFADELLKQENL